jgi:hypothetical protein
LKKLDGDKDTVVRDRIALDKRTAEAKAKDIDLLKREVAVKKIEDLVALANKAKADLESIADREAKLGKAKEDFEKSCVIREKALKDAEYQRDLRSKKLDERETALAEEKETYKHKILENLKNLKKLQQEA